jgi:DNA-binding PadR family transcriptional regulator
VAGRHVPRLTTTSFALLGLLQRKPWSAYELTRFMRHSILRAVWPRAESHLYSEPKLLEKRGLAVSRQERNGARKRTVYSITESGREALLHWLKEERDSEFRFEYELLVRLAFAESVTIDVALAYLQQVRDEVYRDAGEALAAVEAELAEPQQLASRPNAPYSGAIIHLVANQLESRLRWADHMTGQFSRLAASEETGAQVAEDLYRDARSRIQALLERS